MARASIPSTSRVNLTRSCILFHFYIKPQLSNIGFRNPPVVSYSISTSNHNSVGLSLCPHYVVSYSISTSNHNNWLHNSYVLWLYLIPFLHQTTTINHFLLSVSSLYLIPFLHQTTTKFRCFAFPSSLYLIPFLHQTTTVYQYRKQRRGLYLIPFLHQTTTVRMCVHSSRCCILFHFYIKPQHFAHA